VKTENVDNVFYTSMASKSALPVTLSLYNQTNSFK
jgi:hypothetical protein